MYLITKLGLFQNICFHIRKHTNINHHINTFKEKKHIFTSKYEEIYEFSKYFGGFKECPQILGECGLDLVTVFQWKECGTTMLWDFQG